MFEIVEVGDGLASGEPGLVRIVDRPAEQQVDHLAGAARLFGTGGQQVGATVLVVLAELGDARVDAVMFVEMRGSSMSPEISTPSVSQ